jgi:hypothetical protein
MERTPMKRGSRCRAGNIGLCSQPINLIMDRSFAQRGFELGTLENNRLRDSSTRGFHDKCLFINGRTVWLPGMDSNHDSRLQRPLSYR